MPELSGKRVIGVAGFKNAGKTTLVEKLVRELTSRGYRIATVKHAHHSFDIDVEGKDSFRHRKAGASEVAVVSRERVAIMRELRGAEPPSLKDIIAQLAPCDLVIIEGYKRDSHDKIEARNVMLDHPALAGEDPTVVAIAANGPVVDAPVLVFGRDDVAGLAAFVIAHCGLDETLPGVRRAGPQDAESIRQLTRDVYAKWIPSIGREPLPMLADYGSATINHWVDLYESKAGLAGLIEMIPKADHLLVENIAVAETQQRKGIGTMLLRHAEHLARKCGLGEVRLYTNVKFASNLEYYRHRGYHEALRTSLPDGGTMVHFRKAL